MNIMVQISSICGVDFAGELIIPSLSILMAIFSGEPGLSGFVGAKDDGGGEW